MRVTTDSAASAHGGTICGSAGSDAVSTGSCDVAGTSS